MPAQSLSSEAVGGMRLIFVIFDLVGFKRRFPVASAHFAPPLKSVETVPLPDHASPIAARTGAGPFLLQNGMVFARCHAHCSVLGNLAKDQIIAILRCKYTASRASRVLPYVRFPARRLCAEPGPKKDGPWRTMARFRGIDVATL